MATTLGASVIIIGLIEGLAEATALILKGIRPKVAKRGTIHYS
jgi:hypothetical protein